MSFHNIPYPFLQAATAQCCVRNMLAGWILWHPHTSMHECTRMYCVSVYFRDGLRLWKCNLDRCKLQQLQPWLWWPPMQRQRGERLQLGGKIQETPCQWGDLRWKGRKDRKGRKGKAERKGQGRSKGSEIAFERLSARAWPRAQVNDGWRLSCVGCTTPLQIMFVPDIILCYIMLYHVISCYIIKTKTILYYTLLYLTITHDLTFHYVDIYYTISYYTYTD